MRELPFFATITAYDLADGVGRATADDGEALRFATRALAPTTPVAGMRVRVQSVEPHVLGGLKITKMEHVAGTLEEEAALAARREAERLALLEAARIHNEPFERERLARIAEVQAEVAARAAERRAAEELARGAAEVALSGATGLAAWRGLLFHVGLDELTVDRLMALARPAARIAAVPGRVDCPVGASKIGGLPDVPADFVWPEHGGAPLDFVAQIALPKIPEPVRRSLELPESGLLSFFFAARDQPWGGSRADLPSGRIFYFAPSRTLSRRPLPAVLAEGPAPEETAVALELAFQLPPLGRDVAVIGGSLVEPGERRESFELTPGLAELRLGKLVHPYARAHALHDLLFDAFGHVLGGYAIPVQLAMEKQCAKLRKTASTHDWRCMLQLDSGDDVGEWGDDGRLYFWCTLDDARGGAFSDALCLIQSH